MSGTYDDIDATSEFEPEETPEERAERLQEMADMKRDRDRDQLIGDLEISHETF